MTMVRHGNYVLTDDGEWVEAKPAEFKGGLFYRLINFIKALFR